MPFAQRTFAHSFAKSSELFLESNATTTPFSAAPIQSRISLASPCVARRTVYMFILFDVLEKIAHDYSSKRESTIRMLKILNLVLYVAFLGLSLSVRGKEDTILALAMVVLGAAIIVCAIITAVVLFKLKDEVNSILEKE